MELHGQQMTFNKRRDWSWNYMDFNRVLVTLQCKDGFQNGITWTIGDFWKKKGLKLKLHGLQ
jgi:hypothetical protein